MGVITTLIYQYCYYIMLQNISYTSLEELSINIGSIHNGWMDIDVYDGTTNFSYVASYTTDPLNDLLEATVCMLSGKPYIDRIGNTIHNYYYVDHDLEGANVFWLFDIRDDVLSISIWDDPANELVDFWDTECDMDSNEYQQLIFAHTNLPKPVVAAIGSKTTFGQLINQVFEALELRKPKTYDEFEGWGYNYSQKNFELLASLLKDK